MQPIREIDQEVVRDMFSRIDLLICRAKPLRKLQKINQGQSARVT